MFNSRAAHGNGIIYGSMLYWMNNKSKQNMVNGKFRYYGKVLSNDLSAHNPYYQASSTLNPGTQGLRMVIAPKPNKPSIDAEELKPSNFGKTSNIKENNVIHKSNVLTAMNNTTSNNIHQ